MVAALGGLAPTDGPALAALAIGMVLLAVTAVAAYALVAGHAPAAGGAATRPGTPTPSRSSC